MIDEELTSTPRVAAIVPVHGRFDLTRECLRSLQRQDTPCAITVVDDASPDDTRARLSEEFPEVEVISLTSNVGFAKACNAGFARATADIVVLVNNDVVAEPTMMSDFVRAFRESEAGSATCIILRPDGRIDACGITADRTLAGFLRLHGQPTTRVTDADRYELLGPYGAIAAYRRSALEQVGTFDESLFMYGEELDLAIRLRQAGWKAVETKTVGGTHLGAGTTGRGSTRQVYLAAFGRGYLAKKHARAISGAWFRLGATELMVCLAAVVRDRNLAATRGRIDGFRAAKPTTGGMPPGIDRSISMAESLRIRSGRWERR